MMTPKRTPWLIGAGIFILAMLIGWIVTRNHTPEMGLAEIIGIFHAAMGIGFATGFLSYAVLNALASKRRT